jgi:hypothetical protein
MELNGTHQPIFYANDSNILVENMNTIKKETEDLQYEPVSKSLRTESITKYTLIPTVLLVVVPFKGLRRQN